MRNPIGRGLGRIALCQAKLFTALVLLGAPCLEGAVLFSEDFANNNAGWTLGTNWQIGPAVASAPTGVGNGDPGTDYTPTADNGIAGTVIGGNVPIGSGSSLLTSPVINLAVPGTVTLSFWRWLNSDSQQYVRSSVEVFNGSSWVNVFENGTTAIADSAWTQFSYDVSAYKNADFRVRFGYVVLVNHGALPASGWNLDDVLVESADTAVPEPSAGLLTGAALSALALRGWRRRAA